MAARGRPAGYLAVSGHTNIDYLAHVKRLPGPNQSMEFTGTLRALGGTAANIALTAARLDVPTALISFVGADFPAPFSQELRAAGVDTRALVRVRGLTTPVCWIFTDPQERQVAFINQGAAVAADRHPVPASTIAAARVLHLSTGRPAHHLATAAAARRRGVAVHFDPGQELAYVWTRPLFRRMLARSDALFGNEGEMQVAMKYLGARNPKQLLDHVGLVVGTRGRKGSFALTAQGKTQVPGVRARRVVNATGAGDAFRGGFYAARYRSLSMDECLRWGAAAASLSVERPTGAPAGISVAAIRRRLGRGPP
jgi:sugar/nucleoside kinase (ribokinase family)